MAFIADSIYDNGLSYAQTNGTRLDICSSEPATYAAATSTVSLGNKTALTVGAPQDGVTSGRRVVVPQITDGSVTADGTAAFYALTDGVGELLATGPLSATQVVTINNAFTLDSINITLKDATQA